ncbi:MAG: UDP-glucose 4-epimerase GalE, partial [Planctomycetota bacterium]
ARLVADPTRAGRELGWRARHADFAGIVADAARWHRDHPEGYGS